MRLASFRLSLALSGSLWLSVTPTLAITGQYSGKWLTKTIFEFRGEGFRVDNIEYWVLKILALLYSFHYFELNTIAHYCSPSASSRGWCNLLRPPALTPFLGHPEVIFTCSLWPPSSIQSLPYFEVIIVGIIQNPVVVCIVLYPLFSVHLLASPAKTS